jgi:hypothetical protein
MAGSYQISTADINSTKGMKKKIEKKNPGCCSPKARRGRGVGNLSLGTSVPDPSEKRQGL